MPGQLMFSRYDRFYIGSYISFGLQPSNEVVAVPNPILIVNFSFNLQLFVFFKSSEEEGYKRTESVTAAYIAGRILGKLNGKVGILRSKKFAFRILP